MDFALSATIRSPQVIAAASNVKSALALAKSGRATAPAQLTVAPWLGSPNGTTEEFLFIQSLEAGGRRSARVSSHDALLLDAQANYNETLVSVYTKILAHVAQLLAAERSHAHAIHVENNLAESVRVIETQVLAGTKPGSDLEIAKAMLNAARIESELALERTRANRISLEAYAVGEVHKPTSVEACYLETVLKYAEQQTPLACHLICGHPQLLEGQMFPSSFGPKISPGTLRPMTVDWQYRFLFQSTMELFGQLHQPSSGKWQVMPFASPMT